MAGAETVVPCFSVEKPEIPKRLFRGSKFLKWPKADDDSTHASPITLRVDLSGHVIYWQEPNRDTECLEISTIRDTRVGRYAKEPKNPELSKMVNSAIPLVDRCFTIAHGTNFVDINYLNFISVEANAQEVTKEWADFLLKLAYHPSTRHISVQTSIEKAYIKLRLETNKIGEIPVKKLIKLLGGKSKRVENALMSLSLPTSHKKSIPPNDLQLASFKKLLQLCCPRPEMDAIFSDLVSGARKMYIPYSKVREFVNTVQRDPKLNEILHPYQSEDQAQELVQNYEPNAMFGQKGHLTQEGFDAYLQSDDSLFTEFDYYVEHQDMSLPLSHYFVNSSHNTYLTGNQYRSRSTAEMYRQVLLSGCRCVELDCWEGENGPIINHGFTLCTPVPFKDVIEAINESAFKTSPYPVILSFENHVESPAQQALMAQYCRDIFKEKLLIDPLDSHPINPGEVLPAPKDLLYKIIIKNKKQKEPKDNSKKRGSTQVETQIQNGLEHHRTSSTSSVSSFTGKSPRPNARTQSTGPGAKKPPISPLAFTPTSEESENSQKVKRGDMHPKAYSVPTMNPSNSPDGDLNTSEHVPSTPEQVPSSPDPIPISVEETAKPKYTLKGSEPELAEKKEPPPDIEWETSGIVEKTPLLKTDSVDKKDSDEENEKENKDDDNDDSEDEGCITTEDFEVNAGECGTASKESKAYEAMSSLVNYIQPVRFKQFEISEKKNRSNEISSFTETAALRLVTMNPSEFVRYNRRQTSRIYPRGARVDSSNYVPQVFWNVGCQFVALNFQILDLPMQLNLGLFEYNGSTGLLLKPEHMRKKDRMFDPFTKTMDGVVASTLTIRIISGQFLSQQKMSTYVEVDMFGLPNDTSRKQFKTKTVDGNSINPFYNSPEFTFKKIVLPSLAVLRLAVMETNNLVGYRFLKVEGLKPGYRYITLRNEGNQPITMASLFVQLQVKDFVPEVHKDIFYQVLTTFSSPVSLWSIQDGVEADIVLPTVRHHYGIAYKAVLSSTTTLNGPANSTMLRRSRANLADWLANPITYLKKRDQEKKEREAREKAIKMLLDPEEIRRFDKDRNVGSTPAEYSTLPKRKANKKPLLPNDFLGKPGDPNNTEEKEDKENVVASYLEKFEPQTIADLKLGKSYLKLTKKFDDAVNKMRKKHKEEFVHCYNVMFGSMRRPSVLDAFKKVYNNKKKDQLINMSPAQTDDDKRDELIKLLSLHYQIEKDMQLDEIPNFLKKFEAIVRDHQKAEMAKLKDLASREQLNVQRRKDAEKERRIKLLPPNLTKDELDSRKKEINDAHINECVRDRSNLLNKQTEREKAVQSQQEKTLMNFQDEEKYMQDKIESQYREKLQNVHSSYDDLCSEMSPNGNANCIEDHDGDYDTYL